MSPSLAQAVERAARELLCIGGPLCVGPWRIEWRNGLTALVVGRTAYALDGAAQGMRTPTVAQIRTLALAIPRAAADHVAAAPSVSWEAYRSALDALDALVSLIPSAEGQCE